MNEQGHPPQSFVDALQGTFGRHAGYRASHAKGAGVRGHFLPAPHQGGLSVPMLTAACDVRGRFSIGGGKPGISDKSPTVRGFGLSITAARQSWVVALTSAPVFFANSGDQFKAYLAARAPDPALGGPNPEAVKAFNAANPNTMPHQTYLATTAPCRCYGDEVYHSAHAYGFQANDGSLVHGRIALRPVGGRIGLTDDERATLPDTFLMDRLADRLGRAAAVWTLTAVLAGPGDPVDDPTTPWTDAGREITLGQVVVTAIDPTASGMVFDPAILPSGVATPPDQIFGLRSSVYAASYRQRAG